MALTVYHIVRHDPPIDEDFWSYVEQGRGPLSDDPGLLRQAEGVSVYGTFDNARVKALQLPYLGHLIAEMQIPDGAPVTCSPTGGRAGHNTLWVEPKEVQAATLRSYVVKVVSVNQDPIP
jgi:hypothetical protein